MHRRRDGRRQPSGRDVLVLFILMTRLLRFDVLVDVFQIKLVLRLVDLKVLADLRRDLLSLALSQGVELMSDLVRVLAMLLIARAKFFAFVLLIQTARLRDHLRFAEQLLWHMHQNWHLELASVWLPKGQVSLDF